MERKGMVFALANEPQFSHEDEPSQAHNQCLASSRFPVYPWRFQKHNHALMTMLEQAEEEPSSVQPASVQTETTRFQAPAAPQGLEHT